MQDNMMRKDFKWGG